MAHSNTILTFLVILATVIVAIPKDADGSKILNYDEDSPTYPWERIVYRGNMGIQKRQDEGRTEYGKKEIPEEINRTFTAIFQQGNKRIYGFDESMSGLKHYGKARGSVIYGRASLPVMVASSYPEPNQ